MNHRAWEARQGRMKMEARFRRFSVLIFKAHSLKYVE
jgi:hypothetical protein